MLRLSKIIKNFQETGALNENLSVFGFGRDVFLTKAGDLGLVLSVDGVDYECLDSREIDNLTKRLESALKLFDPKFRVYQVLFKANRPAIPSQSYADEVVNAAIQARIEHFQAKADHLYSISIYFVVMYEGFRYQKSFATAISKVIESPALGVQELKALFASRKQIVFVLTEIEKAERALRQQVENFILQLKDFLHIEVLDKEKAYQFLRALVNFSPEKRSAARLKHNTHIDFFMADSAIECYS